MTIDEIDDAHARSVAEFGRVFERTHHNDRELGWVRSMIDEIRCLRKEKLQLVEAWDERRGPI